jgi:3-mercaptopyruvate sulfurtransferase SseA
MAQPAGIKVEGLRDVMNVLKQVGVPTAEVSAASQQAAEIVAKSARTLVPVRSGRLRASIRSKKQARKVLVSAGNNGSVPYANPIHWGWFYDKENFIKKNILPNPFFSKALGLTREQVYRTYFDNINKMFNKYNKNRPTNG